MKVENGQYLPTSCQRQRVHVRGVVQGVGFRPFVYGLAHELQLTGFVGNDSEGVFIEVEGPAPALAAFGHRLQSDAPAPAIIDQLELFSIPPIGADNFIITPSKAIPNQRTLISPDLSVCDDCLQELFDPTDRRYLYPFINCTNCGPRFTITKDIPYDRSQTTMADFVMCPACQAEYDDPADRRFHAQPNACETCGPQVQFVVQGKQAALGREALALTQDMLQNGGIVAVKGLGGFHLACDATNGQAVQTLRTRKERMDKPFALMVADMQTAHQIAQINEIEEAHLTSRVRPIVLLEKRLGTPLAQRLSDQIAPGNHTVGLMLPYTPLHYLLFHVLDPTGNLQPAPCNILVMTSGNLASEPIAIDNREALGRLSSLADAFLFHDRPIHVPCDDSVICVIRSPISETEMPLRRSRGYAPFPIKLPLAVRPTVAVGGELKSTFCLADERYGFMSQHIGDMENLETLDAFRHATDHFSALFRHKPELLVCDMHPRYLSSQWAVSQANDSAHKQLVQVQHHHAHIAAVMAEHGLDGTEPVIGVSFDGTGYGPDGAVWGGEILMADYHGYRRVAHLNYVPLPGGDAAIKHPARMALAHLWNANVLWDERLPPVRATTQMEQGVVRQQLERGLNSVPTSSMGRLFDAIAALTGLRQLVTYEGQGAIELESVCDPSAVGAYDFAWNEVDVGKPIVIQTKPVIEAVVADVLQGVPVATISARFHRAVVNLIVDIACHLRRQEKETQVALSGGVFQNRVLLQATITKLQIAGFDVLTHQQVPPNDGGLALGQVMIANMQREKSSLCV